MLFCVEVKKNYNQSKKKELLYVQVLWPVETTYLNKDYSTHH